MLASNPRQDPSAASVVPGLRVLTQEEIKRFHERGAVKLTQAFPREAASRMQAAMVRRLEEIGIFGADPATWSKQPIGLRLAGRDPSFAAINTPRLHHAIDDLVGPGRWQIPRSWGLFRVTMPEPRLEPWTVPWHAWHADCTPVDPPALFVLLLISDIAPRGGATMLVEGSHRLTAGFLARSAVSSRGQWNRTMAEGLIASHPWLRSLTVEDGDATSCIQRFMSQSIDPDGIPLRVIEACGSAGDAWLCHATMLHNRSTNHADVPRFMRLRLIDFVS